MKNPPTTADLRFFLNGAEIKVPDPDPQTLLLDWLRSPEVGLTGAKKVCAQGGCGACTVMVMEWDAAAARPKIASVNACMHPLCSLDGKQVVTVEGTGSSQTSLSPVQYRIAKDIGTQCGFCTPGFVMNMHAYLADRQARGEGAPTQAEIEAIFDGNLCRCTGYRPILYAMKHFAAGWNEQDEEGCLHTLVAPEDRLPCHSEIEIAFPKALEAPPRPLFFERAGYQWYRPTTLEEVHELLRRYRDPANVRLVVGNTSTGVYDRFTENPRVLIDVSAVSDLRSIAVRDDGLYLGANTTYSELLDTLDRLLGTELGVRRSAVAALRFMVHHTAGRIVRNAASLAGNTMMVVRHVQAGAPFPSDAFTAYCALGVRVLYSLPAEGSLAIRELPILDFADAYQKSATLRRQGILLGYVVPWTRRGQTVQTYKTALRPENAHSIVNAGFYVSQSEDGVVRDARLVYGGIGPIAFHAKSAERWLCGKQLDEKTLRGTLRRIRQDLAKNLVRYHQRMAGLPDEGFSNEYRIALAESYFYQFFIQLLDEQNPSAVKKELRSAGQRLPRPVSRGHQAYEKYPQEYPVNQPYLKLGAFLQATGEAKYTHDLPLPARGLNAAVVTSQRALAHISYRVPGQDGVASAADVAAYLRGREPGFVDFVTVADIPTGGTNVLGAGNDTCFADGEVTAFGQCIGLTLADQEELAIRLAEEIARELVVYAPCLDPQGEVIEPVLTIAEARAKGQIFPDLPPYPVHVWKVRRPGSQLGWADTSGETQVAGKPCRVVHGRQETGSQLHFYLETQAALAIPGEQNRLTVHSSTQSPDSVQGALRDVLGIPMSHLGVEVQRIGGGYGGKTTRTPWVAAAAAVAAWKWRRPVKLVVRRENDSAMIGHRHPLAANYAVAIATGQDHPENKGLLVGQKTEFWLDGGNTYDCSFVVMDCIQLRCDSAYAVPNYETSGDVCQTNTATNGAFRSMGLVQAMLAQEDGIEQAAHAIGMPAEWVREKNLYQLGGITPFGQVLDYCYLSTVWQRLKRTSDFVARRAAVDAFNAANRWKKRGISIIPVKYGSGYNAPFLEQAGALVEVYAQDGTILIQQGGVEIGQGLQIKVAQVAAKELNVPLGIVEIAPTNTRVVPNPVSTGASTGSGFNAAAAKKACRQLRERLETYCLGLLSRNGPDWCQKQGIDFWNYAEGWRAQPPGSTKTLWQNIVALANGDRINLSAQVRFQQAGGTAADTGLIFKPEVVAAHGEEAVYHFTGFTYSAACTEVEIDVLTGQTTVLRADLLYDMGKSLNPAVDIGQVEGAFVQGLGFVMSEEVVYQPDGPLRGALNSDNTWRYKVPATTSIPLELNVDLFPRSAADEIPENPYDLYSSKEVGEPPLVLAITAFFAIKNAILAARRDRGHQDWFELQAPATVQRIREACAVEVRDLTL